MPAPDKAKLFDPRMQQPLEPAPSLRSHHSDEPNLLSTGEATLPEAAVPRLNEDAYVRQLENDLRVVREDLQNVIEELENSNEALRASNEETISMNEELRCANDELGAFKVRLEQAVAERTADLTEKKARLRAILSSATSAIFTIDHEAILRSLNPAAEQMFGYSVAELIGQDVRLLIPFGTDEDREGYLNRFLDIGKGQIVGVNHEVEVRRKDGTHFPADLIVSQVAQFSLYTCILIDISRRKQLEREVVEIATLEQQRIGQDLHDECGQQLTALGIFAGGLVEALEKHAPQDVAAAQRIGRGITLVLRQVRNISRGLAQPEVAADGLSDALADLTSRLGETSGIRFTLDCIDPVNLRDSIQATQLFHIAQEACTNALRHAEAKNVVISLHSNDLAVVLEIRDDGIGILNNRKEGLGLRIMQNRASVIGATLTIGPARPRGTVLICTLS